MSDKPEEIPPFDGRIWILAVFQEFVNPNVETNMGVTLNVHGTVVSGTMVGSRVYYEGIGKQFMDNLKTDNPEGEGKKMIQDMFEKMKQPIPEEDIEKVRFDHIFLKNVKIFDGPRVFRPAYWVGKIDSVDGFVLGEFDVKETQE
jgi:hypothetical protein